MRKIILLSFIIPLLATSCGNSTPSKQEGEWSIKIQEEMLLYLGEVLPFADFDEVTLEAEYTELTIKDYGANGNNYSLIDDNETDVLKDYGEKLIAKGYTFTKDELEFECYEKDTSKGKLVVYAKWYPETTILGETAPAGNQIDAYLYF